MSEDKLSFFLYNNIEDPDINNDQNKNDNTGSTGTNTSTSSDHSQSTHSDSSSTIVKDKIHFFENLNKTPRKNLIKKEFEKIELDINFEYQKDKPISQPEKKDLINLEIREYNLTGRRKKKKDDEIDLDFQFKEYENIFDKDSKKEEKCFDKPISYRRKYFYCSKCKLVLKDEKTYNDHTNSHKYEDNLNHCICKKCGIIFANDDLFYNHLCSNNNLETYIVPIDPDGSFPCPNCENRYSTSFLLGEHFITSHNDYSEFRALDSKLHTGFPGFDLLKKIGMIKYHRKKNIKALLENHMCDICCIEYSFNEQTDDKINHQPIYMTCCCQYICYDCLLNYLTITDTLFCPFCRKDHTQMDISYITFVEMTSKIDKERWISWWENHLDIFL
jgi:hypothetical protein